MRQDIGPLLTGWDYVPGELRVRAIIGAEDRRKIQIRTDLGLMQLEWNERPDGSRPHDSISLMDFHLEQLHRAKIRGESFALARPDCWALGREAVQYYWRRMSFFELKEYELAERDALHNLSILDLCERFGEHPEDRGVGEQFRVFVTTHRIQARALARLEEQDFAGALAAIDRGTQQLEGIVGEQHGNPTDEECTELRFLRDWRLEVEANRPRTEREQLTDALQTAVEREQFERAARLRDRLAALDGPGL